MRAKWTWMPFLCVAWSAAPCLAQVPGTRPTFSPYINLSRRDVNPAINYYGLVRPQLRYNESIQQLQQATQSLQQQQDVTGAIASERPPTGHATGFLNHNRYFLNRGGATPSSGRGAAPAAPVTLNNPPRRSR